MIDLEYLGCNQKYNLFPGKYGCGNLFEMNTNTSVFLSGFPSLWSIKNTEKKGEKWLLKNEMKKFTSN